MEWIKHSTNSIMSPALRAIYQKYQMKGIGMYWVIVEMLMLRNGCCRLSEIMTWSSKGMDSENIRDILDEEKYGLFRIEDDLVFMIDNHRNLSALDVPAEYLVPARAKAGTQAGAEAGAEAGDSRNREDKRRIEKISSSAEETSMSPMPMMNQETKKMEAIYAQLLERPDNQIWREGVLINHPAARKHLEKDWNRCIDFFWKHMLAQGKDFNITNLQSAKSYFCNFLGNPTTLAKLGSLLKTAERAQTKAAVNPDDPYRFEDPPVDGRRSYGGRPIPADAPPRPSADAEWDVGWLRWRG